MKCRFPARVFPVLDTAVAITRVIAVVIEYGCGRQRKEATAMESCYAVSVSRLPVLRHFAAIYRQTVG